jgi:hypothetical protein
MTEVYEFTVEKLMHLGGTIELQNPLRVKAHIEKKSLSKIYVVRYEIDLPIQLNEIEFAYEQEHEPIHKGLVGITFEQKMYPLILAYYFHDISCGLVKLINMNLSKNNLLDVLGVLDWNDYNQCWNFFRHETLYSKNEDIVFWKSVEKIGQAIDKLHQANLIFDKIRTYGFHDRDNNKDIETLLHVGNAFSIGTINWLISQKIDHLTK